MALNIFDIKTAAIIGASPYKGKVGYEIAYNFVKGNFPGKVFFVNPNELEVLGVKCNKSLKEVELELDLAVIAVKAEKVPQVLKDCVDKKVKTVVVISAGFSETGKEGNKLEDKCKAIIKGSKTRVIGPNCIGIYDSYTGVDTLFVSKERSARPKKGGISFIAQSGAFGVTMLDWLVNENIGISRFISYGNGVDINETELLETLQEDKNTKVIVAYFEGFKDGKKFIEIAKKSKKPIIVLKAGKSAKGAEAVMSHTGSLAGEAEIYSGAFKQAKIIEAKDWYELFDIAKAFEKQQKPKGKKLCIITNGGGFGVLATDEAEELGFEIIEPSKKLVDVLKKEFPNYAIIKNPIDLTGDANPARYRLAVSEAVKEFDAVLVILLLQTPTINESILSVMSDLAKESKKPLFCCSTGSSYARGLIKQIEDIGIPVYETSKRALSALAAMIRF